MQQRVSNSKYAPKNGNFRISSASFTTFFDYQCNFLEWKAEYLKMDIQVGPLKSEPLYPYVVVAFFKWVRHKTKIFPQPYLKFLIDLSGKRNSKTFSIRHALLKKKNSLLQGQR